MKDKSDNSMSSFTCICQDFAELKNKKHRENIVGVVRIWMTARRLCSVRVRPHKMTLAKTVQPTIWQCRVLIVLNLGSVPKDRFSH